jgi:hypothetical protein
VDELFLITDLLLITSQFLVVAEVRLALTFSSDSDCWYSLSVPEEHDASSIGHPPHSSASPVELRLRVGPRALSGKKKELR